MIPRVVEICSKAGEDEAEIPFDVATLYFELNNTDGDLGFHGLIDGDAWKRLEIENPKERRLLNVFVQSRLRRQGLTEFFFESAEPTFDELAPKKFFRRFPEGEYEISGIDVESDTDDIYVSGEISVALFFQLIFGDEFQGG